MEPEEKKFEPLPEKMTKNLLSLQYDCEKEDEYSRLRFLREAKMNELYWHGFQGIFWDQNIGNFRIPTQELIDEAGSREDTKIAYDYVVNIFKANGLSIIAALSADAPGVPFAPINADNPQDVRAAKSAEILGKVISKKNKTKLLFYQALFTLYTSHFCAAYSYYDRDKKYGTIDRPKFAEKDVKTTPDTYNCTADNCDYSVEAQPDVQLDKCPACGADTKLTEGETETQMVQDGTEPAELGQIKIEILGTLNSKLPTYAIDQSSCDYFIKFSDHHYSKLRTLYDYIDRDKLRYNSEENDYERTVRLQSTGRLYTDGYTNSLLVLKQVWLRPSRFDCLEEEDAKELKEKFPDGVYFAVVNKTIVDYRSECMDDHITITKGDLSRSVTSDPLSKPLVPLQDLKNQVMNLATEQLEHSIPSTFADPQILDFETFSNQESLVGGVYPTKSPATGNKKIGDFFYKLETSTLNAETLQYNGVIDSEGQFVVGAFPSIFGGPQTEGSKTLGEYQESRSYALQRLSIPYQLLYFWYADLIYKCVKDHIKNMIDDENYVAKSTDGQFINIKFLEETFRDGKFDLLLPESSVDLPVSYSQKRQLLQGIVQLNNEELNSFLFAPENRTVVFRYLGLEEVSDLDSNQVTKQLREIAKLITEEPLDEQTDPQIQGQQASVPIEPEIDDDEIHLRIGRNFLCSDVGQDLKYNKPKAYLNVLLHMREHMVNLQTKMQSQDQSSQPTNGKPPIQQGQNGKPQQKQLTVTAPGA